MINRIIKYFTRLLSSKDDASMKRFIIFFVTMHFILGSFMALFGVIRQTVDKDMMKFILDCDFYIILVGLGVIGVENVASVLAQRIGALGSILKSKKTTTEEVSSAPVPTPEGPTDVNIVSQEKPVEVIKPADT